MWSQDIKMDEINQRCISITADIENIHDGISNDSTLVFYSHVMTTDNDLSYEKYDPSGIVLLDLFSLNQSESNGCIEWDKRHVDAMAKHKNNVLQGNVKHNGSIGNIILMAIRKILE